MKKTLLLASLFAVGAAFATDFESANALGVLQIDSSTKPQKILLSVPFAGYGKDAQIKVSELVETSTLPENTKLYVAHANDYYTWRLKSDKTWEPVNGDQVVKIDTDGEQDQNKVETPPADQVTIERGNSFWLELQSAPAENTKYTLLGQQGPSGQSITLTGGKWNLVGNPNVTAYDVAANISGTRRLEDSISVQDGNSIFLKTYWYNGSTWKCGRISYTEVKIEPGDGCWVYVNDDATLSF